MQHSKKKTFIVGIGASAGGLEATSQLIAQLKPELPCSYVLLQHLSPSHRSMLVEILARTTALSVREAAHGDLPCAGTLYVVPASYNALIKDGKLQLVAVAPEVVPKPSINQFLISLAAEEGEAAIGIILSGTGSDGVAGLRAIQVAGGFTLAQKPESAKYDGMPLSAIEAGVVDHVLTPEDIAARLPQLLELPAQDATHLPPDMLERLLDLLRQQLRFDFSGYKIGTLMRRVRRREIATGNPDLSSYLAYVQAHPGELELLARDILISVTAFFRDREAFQALRRTLLELCTRKPPGSELRVWVAGCASGEEAYSIAILLADALGDRLTQYRVQIFATDIDEEALNTARRGVYPAAALSELPADQLERHFRSQNNAYEAGKHLRDMLVFARHNLVSDPPFLRLDLVSCRNVLIYFDAPLQAKVLQAFHFGLHKEGHLFLGRSESVAQADALFAPVDRRERLFRKKGETPSSPPTLLPASAQRSQLQRREQKVQTLLAALVQHYGLTVVLCDEQSNILHSVGQVERYLHFPHGVARLSIADVVLPSLRGELLSLLHRSQQKGKPQRGRRRKLEQQWLRLGVDPILGNAANQTLVLFMPEPAGTIDEAAPAAVDCVVDDELISAREHLQTLVEEMATANEEMQALNEEAQASNEELQATNEELEAANEELQASNQELLSLNEELNVKTLQLSQLSTEYAHLYDALPSPVLVFDRALQLQRCNTAAALRLDLRSSAMKQHVARLSLPQALNGLEPMLGRALALADRCEATLKLDERTLRMTVTPGLDSTGGVVTLVVALFDITDIASAQERLTQSQERLAALMEKTSVIFALKDVQGRYLYANRRWLDFFAIEDNAYNGQTDFALLPQTLAADLWQLDMNALRTRSACYGEHTLQHRGQRCHLKSTHQVLLDAEGQPSAFIFEAEDVTAARLAEEQLLIAARVFDQAGEAILVTDAQAVIQTVNAAFTRITGYYAEEAVGQPTSLLRSGRHSPDFYRNLWQALHETGHWQGEIWNKRKNGEIYPEWLTINRVEAQDGLDAHYVAVFSDITQIKDSQRKAEYLSTHDPLTGLPNRTLFHDRLRHALAQARRKRQRVALLFIDLDNFKNINDTLGHDVGDELLRMCAARLREVVRDVDTVARLGGDEFTAVLCDCSAESANQVGLRIVDDLAASFEIAGRALFVSASIGVAFFPEDGSDSSALVRAADAAMYRAKELGRNRIEFFKPELQVRMLKRATLESALREALRQRRLRLVYQPKFTLMGRCLVGAEALLRWRDSELGDVSPADFIPVAEASGLILELGQVVEDLLLAQLRAWLDMGLKPPRVAMNVSPRSIREPQFAAQFLAKIETTSIPSELVQIEITEGALLENSVQVGANLNTLHAAGLQIAIDDFGTGYSSLSYLKRLPLTELKIDKSFVDGLGQDADDEAITRAVLGLARALDLQTVAEGVETERQLAWLKLQGCDLAQGYLLSHPLEAAVFEDLLVVAQRHG